MKKGYLMLLFQVIAVPPVFSEQTNDFSTAVNSPITLGKTVVVDKAVDVGTMTVSGRSIRMLQGGIINVARGETMTLSTPDAGRYQIFGGSGTVCIPNGNIIPQWFPGENDTSKIASALDSLKCAGSRGGTLVIPSDIDRNAKVPSFKLSKNQAISVIDYRTDRPSPDFGSILVHSEARDKSGGLASEYKMQGLQNPAFVLNTLSDGTAQGYTMPNKSSTFLHQANGVDQWRWTNDLLFQGNFDYGLYQYANGKTGAIALYVGTDVNYKNRFDFSPILFSSSKTEISDASNESPIVITTSTPHGMRGTIVPVSISGVFGNSAANGSHIAVVIDKTHFALKNIVGNGGYAGGGTVTANPNAQRAVLNVPKVQGGTESIITEGQLVSTMGAGTAPIVTISKAVDTNHHARPYVVSPNGVQQVSATAGSGNSKIVVGGVNLVSGSKVIEFTKDAAFTNSGSYIVTATDETGVNPVRVVRDSGSQITITGTGNDYIQFMAIGY